MGWFSSLVERRASATLAQPSPWLEEALSATPATSGAAVTETSALSTATVYACVRVLAETVAQLPIKLYRKLPNGGKSPDETHPLYPLLHDLANPEMTAYEFKSALQGHLALWGNAYAEIERDALGRVVALWPLRPDCMTVTRDRNQQRVWLYRLPNGKETVFAWQNPTRTQPPILHLRGLSPDGFVGYSPLRLMRDTIGLAIAAEEYGARLFANNAQPRGVLQTPNLLSPEAALKLKASWESAHRGLTNAHRVAVLEQGITWQQIGISPDDAQFLQTRKFQVNEICRAFRVPPHMVADVERSTSWGSGIEQQQIGFLQYSLMPWIVAWEQGIARDLLSGKAFETHQVRFVVEGLLRSDTASRYQAYAVGRQWGWLSVNDVRELENMNPIPDGNTYLVPLNMVPADTEEPESEDSEESDESDESPEPGDDDGTGTSDDDAAR